LEISRREARDGSVELRLTGELDLSTAPQLEEAIAEVMDPSTEEIVVDLSGLSFMDSSGLRVLLAADSDTKASGKRLRIARGPEAVDRVFRLTGLDAHLEMFGSPEGV
jgi:anti-sigma B factor antagonist